MSGSLRDLTATFVSAEALKARAVGIPAEEAVLQRYTFLPYVRTGVSASLRQPFTPASPARAVVQITVPVEGPGRSADAGVRLDVRGPGDVACIDQAQIIRRHPTPGTASALTENLAHVEFDRPDLPWMFTPAGPAAGERLQPWISLVTIPLTPGVPSPVTPAAGGRLGVLHTTRAELPLLSEAWAWAHAQVMGGPKDPGASISQRLGPASPQVNLSRVMSPRHLAADTSYVACLVPSFRAGVQAGLGQAVTETTLAPAWADDADPAEEIVLPVYASFVFATGDAGDFKSLAERIQPLAAPPGVGRRRVDTSHPGHGLPDIGDPLGDGAQMVVQGPLVSPQDPTGQDGWPSEAQQQWPSIQHDDLIAQLNAPAVQRSAPPGADGRPPRPTVGPPLYAGTHIARDRTEPTAPAWFRQLNEDPRHRVVAGLGSRVEQMDQEALMASAWDQVDGIEAANAALRAAQLGRYVGASIHRRHLQTLDAARLVHVTAPAHARLLSGAVTVRTDIAASVLPLAATSGAFRRLARTRGPLARFSGTGAVSRATALLSLVTDGSGLARDYVRTYRNPDGIDDISVAARSLVGQSMVERAWGPGATIDARAAALAGPSFTDALATGTLAELDPGLAERPAVRAGDALGDLLGALPTPALIREDPAAAAVARTVAGQLAAVLPTATRWRVPTAMAVSAGLDVGDQTGPLALVDRARVAELATRVHELTGAHDGIERFDDPVAAARLGHRLTDDAPAGALRAGLAAVAARLVGAGAVAAEPTRPDLQVGDLRLLSALEPGMTVTRRVLGRMTARPSWLAATWFDDQRVRPVMAAPSFPHAMYEALDRYDRQWLIPGVARIPMPEIATLLETNAEFVESFLVGLNHEFARELVWRGYPTDGRATCFRSFFTTTPELLQDVHLFDGRALGDHVSGDLTGSIVLLIRGELVRRYPGLVAHAVRQAGKDGNHPLFAAAAERTLFQINLAPDMLLVGFALTATAVAASDPQGVADPVAPYWFLLAENPTEPRFGLDDGERLSALRDDLRWADLLPNGGRFLSPARGPAQPILDGPAPPTPSPTPVAWGQDAAAVAHILYQPPSRAAFRARTMLGGGA